MDWIEISVAAASVAFVVLVLYVLWTLHAARTFMRRTDAAIARFTSTADETMRLSRQLMRAMRGMIDDLHAQSQKLQGACEAVADFGGAVAQAAGTVRHAAGTLAKWAGSPQSGWKAGKEEQPSSNRRETPKRSAAGEETGSEWMRIAIRLYRSWRDTNAQEAGASNAGRQEKE